mgnify:CR=1 FL=1
MTRYRTSKPEFLCTVARLPPPVVIDVSVPNSAWEITISMSPTFKFESNAALAVVPADTRALPDK